jgi:hypothetical protein
MRTYKTAIHPKTGKPHVVGYVGDGQWMEINGPYPSRVEAERACLTYERAEISEKKEILGWNVRD